MTYTLLLAEGGTPPFAMPSASAMVGHGEMYRESELTGKAIDFCGGRIYQALTSLRNLKALLGRLKLLKVLSCFESFAYTDSYCI